MPAQLHLNLESSTPSRREDFVVSEANAEGIGRFDRWRGGVLALVGPAGVGKSHLAEAWADEVGAIRLGAGVELAELASVSGAMLLEDADRTAPDELLFHLINIAQRPGAALLLTARSVPGAWATRLPDLRSRLNALAVVELTEPDEATLAALLTRFFRERNVSPSPELIGFLIRRIERSAASAREIVRRLDDAAHASGRPVGRPLARELLSPEADG